jgi:acyl-CoA synthetase (AMP-forming)/AMP-acid ligase II
MNIVDSVLFQCRFQPAEAALCAPGAKLERMSYGKLARAILSIGAHARAEGLKSGDVVALCVKDQIFHAALILGLTRLGIVTVSGRTGEFPAEINVTAVIADANYAFRNAGRVVIADLSWIEGDGTAGEKPTTTSGDDLCRITLTSGTTGEPKAVAFSHEMVERRILRNNTVFGGKLPDCSRVFVDLGLATGLGFCFFIYVLARGGTVFFRGVDVVETMQAFGLYQVQAMIASPAALAEFVDAYERAPMFNPSFKVIVCGGSLISKSLNERARARLCSSIVSLYGATETSMVATAPAHLITDIDGAVGYPTPGVGIEIVDGEGRALPHGAEGVVRIKSEFGVSEYLGDPAASAKTFRDGAFYPGDVGRLTADGLLVISGREQAILNLGGDKVHPERIEEVLTAFKGIVRAGAYSTKNALGVDEVRAAIMASEAIDEAALRVHCEKRLPPPFVPRKFIPVGSIPVNEMGKIDRRGLPNLGG